MSSRVFYVNKLLFQIQFQCYIYYSTIIFNYIVIAIFFKHLQSEFFQVNILQI